MSLVSIAVPARSATQYLLAAVGSALSLSGDVEVVVGLNSGDGPNGESIDELTAMAAKDRRLRILRAPRLLSMTENFRFTFAGLRGDWQTIIGSDDAVLPTLLPLARLAETHFPAVRFLNFARARYRWPGIKPDGNSVFIESMAECSVRVTKRDAVESVIDGRRPYLVLPALYNGGLVRRELVTSIGLPRLFNSLSPDVSAAVALAMSREPVLHFEIPAFFAGTSVLSNGASVWRDWVEHGVASSPRTKEFFDLSESDGQGLSPVFSGLPAARFIVAASACTSALADPGLSRRLRRRWALLGCLAVTMADGASSTSRNAVLRAARSVQGHVRGVPAPVWLHGWSLAAELGLILLFRKILAVPPRLRRSRLVLGLQRRVKRALLGTHGPSPTRFTIPGAAMVTVETATSAAMEHCLAGHVDDLARALDSGRKRV